MEVAMDYAYVLFAICVFLALSLIFFVIYLRTDRKKESCGLLQDCTYTKDIKDAQELNRAIEGFRNAWRIARQNDILAKKIAEEERDEFLSEWELFSVTEVLRAETLGQLVGAQKLAFKGGLAKKFVPLIHEEISLRLVEIAGDDVEKLIKAASRAPKGGEAERLAFAKLQRLLSQVQ